VDSLYPQIEIEFIKVLKELQPIIVKSLNSLGGKKPANAGAKYLGVIAKTVNRASDGYLALREAGRMDASKLLIRPALEAVFCGVAAVKDKKFLFRKVYSEWEEHKKLFAKDQAGKDEADKYLKHLLEELVLVGLNSKHFSGPNDSHKAMLLACRSTSGTFFSAAILRTSSA